MKLEAADRELLERAIKKMGLRYKRQGENFYITVSDSAGYGTIVIEGSQARLPTQLQGRLNDIKRAYSAEVIETAAEEFSWTVTEEDDQIVLRRYS